MKKKFNFSKVMIIALIIVIAALSAIVISARNFQKDQAPSTMTEVINDGSGFFDKIIGSPVNFVRNKANDFSNLMSTYQQNGQLKTELSKMTVDENKLKSVEAENADLKKSISLKETLSDYETVSANVITRNPASWSDTLVIDQGEKDGLKVNMIVMANGGAVGRISQVNQSTSKVSLFTSDKGLANKLPISLGDPSAPVYGLLSKYDTEKEAYLVNQIQGQGKLEKGAQVRTSGLGGNSPRDLLIGTVISETKQSGDSLDSAYYVKPASNFYDIHFVFVIKRMVGSN